MFGLFDRNPLQRKTQSSALQSAPMVTREGYENVSLACIGTLSRIAKELLLYPIRRRSDRLFYSHVCLAVANTPRLQDQIKVLEHSSLVQDLRTVENNNGTELHLTVMRTPVILRVLPASTFDFACQYQSGEGAFSGLQKHCNALGLNFSEQGLTCNMLTITGLNASALVTSKFNDALSLLGFSIDLVHEGLDTPEKAYFFYANNPCFDMEMITGNKSTKSAPSLNRRAYFNDFELDLAEFARKNPSTKGRAHHKTGSEEIKRQCLNRFPEFKERAFKLLSDHLEQGGEIPAGELANEVMTGLLQRRGSPQEAKGHPIDRIFQSI